MFVWSWFGCVATPTKTETSRTANWASWTLAICLPEVGLTDASTGQAVAITNGSLAPDQLVQRIELHVQRLGAKTVPVEALKASPAAFDRAGSLKSLLPSQSTAAVTLQRSQATHVLLFSLQAKSGATVGERKTIGEKILPLPVHPFQPVRSPNAALLSAVLVDLKQDQVILRDQVFRRTNPFDEQDLDALIETLFTSTKH